MQVWMVIENSRVYGKTNQYEGNGTYTMTMGGTRSAGTRVQVYGENQTHTWVNVTARGFCTIY